MHDTSMPRSSTMTLRMSACGREMGSARLTSQHRRPQLCMSVCTWHWPACTCPWRHETFGFCMPQHCMSVSTWYQPACTCSWRHETFGFCMPQPCMSVCTWYQPACSCPCSHETLGFCMPRIPSQKHERPSLWQWSLSTALLWASMALLGYEGLLRVTLVHEDADVGV